MRTSPNFLAASSDSHTSTTRNPLSLCPAAWTNSPSTDQSAGVSSHSAARSLPHRFLVPLLRKRRPLVNKHNWHRDPPRPASI